MMIFFFKLFFAGLLVGAFSIAIAATPTIKSSIGIGYFYLEGEYQNKDTSTLSSLPIFIKIERGLTSFKVSSNIYRFNRTSVFNTEIQSSSGWGSSYFSAKQLFKTKKLVHYIDIEGKINTPAPESIDGLSTSGYGFKLSSTAYYRVEKNWFTVTFAYRWRNNKLRDTFSTALGFSRTLSKTFSTGAIVGYEQATQNIGSDKLESTLHLTWKASKKIKYSLYYIKGFNDLKLNWASGFQATYRY